MLDEDVLAGGAALPAADLEVASAARDRLCRQSHRDLEVDRLARPRLDALSIPAPARERQAALAEVEAVAPGFELEGGVLAVAEPNLSTLVDRDLDGRERGTRVDSEEIEARSAGVGLGGGGEGAAGRRGGGTGQHEPAREEEDEREPSATAARGPHAGQHSRRRGPLPEGPSSPLLPIGVLAIDAYATLAFFRPPSDATVAARGA